MLIVAFLVQRIGPYHHARLRAFAKRADYQVTAVEFRSTEEVYLWNRVRDEGGYQRLRVQSRDQLHSALDQILPDVLVCVGYADPEIQQAAAWAYLRERPMVTCSDSTRDDEPRSFAKEAFKRHVVANFDAALVAGARARDYLHSLGMDHARMFQPWDVVDNAHFGHGADLGRADAAAVQETLSLPSRYFLCVARFVPKKNLQRLIEAYAIYVAGAGKNSWSLVLSGSGPEEADLRNRVRAAGLEERVHFPGFVQYGNLPAIYGLAGVFVLASLSDQWGLVVNEAMASGLPVLVSTRCGCMPELLLEGCNGFTIDPENRTLLAESLARVAALDAAQLATMGRKSREIVANFSPENFAEGMACAIASATGRMQKRKPMLTRLVTRLLALRRVSDS